MDAVSETSDVSMKRPSDSCSYWLQKRKRYCRTKPMEGLEFCPSHLSKTSQEVDLNIIKDTCSLPHTTDCNEILPDDIESNSTGMDLVSTNAAVNVLSSNGKLSGEIQQHESQISARPLPFPDRCHFWLEKKRRYCKARVSSLQQFCVEHSVGTKVGSKCLLYYFILCFL